MELIIKLKESKNGINSDETILLSEDVLINITPEELFAQYALLVYRITKNRNEFRNRRVRQVPNNTL